MAPAENFSPAIIDPMSSTNETSRSITEDAGGSSPHAESLAHHTLRISPELAGKRLDQALAQMLPEYSRSRLSDWIKQGMVRVDGRACRPRDKVLGGEQAQVSGVVEEQAKFLPQDLPLNILYEDEDMLVLDKPPGLVVHPAVGNRDGTLLNALLHHDGNLSRLPRAGIVHRLDKDTSGLLVVARSLRAHTSLVGQLQARSVKRQYLAVVLGLPVAGGTVQAPIGRHPTQRTRMAVTVGGKPAVTHYRVSERYRAHSLLEVRLETGRTHQIRVHLAHVHLPILGDPVYCGRLRLPAGASERLIEGLRGFRRQALHAERLSLQHPGSGEIMSWHTPPPPDMTRLLNLLRGEIL